MRIFSLFRLPNIPTNSMKFRFYIHTNFETFRTKLLFERRLSTIHFILATLKYNFLNCFKKVIILLIMATRCICIHTSTLGVAKVCTSDWNFFELIYLLTYLLTYSMEQSP